MKNILYKFLFLFLIFFSFIFVNASEINPSYEEYLKLNDSIKNEIGLVPNEYVNYYEIDKNTLSSNRSNGLYGSSISSYDLRNVNGKRLIPEMKNQYSLNLCWAFATNNMIESFMIRKGKTYNLSENHFDYLSRYYGDTSTFGQANNYFNVVKYLLYGYSPFSEDVLGSYFTSYKNMSYESYLDYDNTLFDVNSLIVFPMLRMQYLKENYSVDAIKSNVEKYNEKMKQHIMNYGAIASGIYWDFYDEDKNLVYNDGSLTREEYSASGHAITIIGWDDNYGSVNIKGTTFTGSWLAMNSWGNEDEYFYISYYDENVVESLIGVKDIRDKNWDNVYFNNKLFQNSSNKQVYEFTKDNINEKINSVKIFHYDSDDVFTISVSDGYNTYKSNSTNVTYGITTIDFSNVSFDNEKVYVTIESKYGKKDYLVALYTSNDEVNKTINIIENDSSVYGTTISHDVMSKGINTGEKYTIKVYDQNNKDITSSFAISNSIVVNDISKLNIVVTGNISSDYIKIVLSNSLVSDSLILYKQRSGTQSSPIVIRKGSELSSLNKNLYYELGNDIDMKKDTTNLYGTFYNSGDGWNPFDFSGHLDGNGYKISNLYSKYGSLFKNVKNASIKEVNFNNFDIVDTSNTDSYSGIIAVSLDSNSVLSNILVNNSDIVCNKTSCGVLVGNLKDGNINNIHIYNSSITGSNTGYVSSDVVNPVNEIKVNNVFVNDTFMNNSSDYYLIYKINISAKVSDLNNINISNNIVNGDSSKQLIASKNISITDDDTYDIYKEKLILSNNYIKSDKEVLNRTVFDKFDTNLWNFDSSSSLYLILFEEDYYLTGNTNLLELSKYSFSGNNIYNIGINTSVSTFLNSVVNKDELNLKFYSVLGAEIKNSNVITTGSYVDVSVNNQNQRYYLIVDGDVNSDGKLSIFDIVKINNHIVYSDKKLSGIYYLAADYNMDDKVSIFDIVKINNVIVGGN